VRSKFAKYDPANNQLPEIGIYTRDKERTASINISLIPSGQEYSGELRRGSWYSTIYSYWRFDTSGENLRGTFELEVASTAHSEQVRNRAQFDNIPVQVIVGHTGDPSVVGNTSIVNGILDIYFGEPLPLPFLLDHYQLLQNEQFEREPRQVCRETLRRNPTNNICNLEQSVRNEMNNCIGNKREVLRALVYSIDTEIIRLCSVYNSQPLRMRPDCEEIEKDKIENAREVFNYVRNTPTELGFFESKFWFYTDKFYFGLMGLGFSWVLFGGFANEIRKKMKVKRDAMEKEKERKLKEKEELKDWYLKSLGDLVRRLNKATTEEECDIIVEESTKVNEKLEKKNPELAAEMNSEGIQMMNRIEAKRGYITGKRPSHFH
jgi:hypothetical protein